MSELGRIWGLNNQDQRVVLKKEEWIKSCVRVEIVKITKKFRVMKIKNLSRAEAFHKNKDHPIVVKRVMIQIQDLNKIVLGHNRNHQKRLLYGVQET